ncbi:MAG TPA: pentapeptide repeat-containing protein [Ktedonobacteraceae bacterium]|nr:pentapeptide repeat-containing protein [Ktedonobacteraceae bacterium]
MELQYLLELLKQGTRVWNQWREEHPSVEIVLSGSNLAEMDLQEAHLEKLSLRGANLGGANLSKAILASSDLMGSDFKKRRAR